MGPLGRAAWPILALALVLKLAFAFGTSYELVHDARDYDRHATSIATGQGYPDAKAPGRATAFRPPAYPVLLAGAYTLTGVAEAADQDRVAVARVLSALITTGVVALIGLLAAFLWGRRIGLIALGLAAVYLPLTLVGVAVMSEGLFALILLAAVTLAVRFRETAHVYRLALALGVLTGLLVLTRANGAILLLPLGIALWLIRRARGGGWRALAPPAAMAVVAVLVIAPWTARNYAVFGTVVPVTTQLGSAMAGTYNEEALRDRSDPAAWRGLRHLDLTPDAKTAAEPVIERRLRSGALRFAADHPGYVAKVGWWNTRRMLDLAGLGKARQTTSTIGIPGAYANWAVPCFWLFGLLAVGGVFTRAARAAPLWLWSVPVLLYLSVVLLAVETPRYRTGIDPFVILLAALACDSVARRVRSAATRNPSPAVRAASG